MERIRKKVASGLAVALSLLAIAVIIAVTQPAASAPGDATADRVFGQPGIFSTNICNNGGISASSLCGLKDAAVDSSGNLYVVDFGVNRVLEYNSPLTTDLVADRVFGQGGSFTSGTCGTSAGTMCNPMGVGLDASATSTLRTSLTTGCSSTTPP